MSDGFAKGDVVELKSGGPAMTVMVGPEGTEKVYTCVWFKGASREQGRFIEAALTTYVAPKK